MTDHAEIERLLGEIRALDLPVIRLMEVCGTHTTAIAEMGLKQLLPRQIRLTSGPGCPVCVTAQSELDAFIALGQARPDVILATYGDMLRVPGSQGSLAEASARGARVKPVYSPLEAVELAEHSPDTKVIFLGVGFETTAPGTVIALREAARRKVANFRIWCVHKLIPPALELLVADPALALDGFLLPGHVSALIGVSPYSFLAQEYRKVGVITGFEPLDLVRGVYKAVKAIVGDQPVIRNEYPRIVREEGNPAAQALLGEAFEPCEARWRGLGTLPGSGYRLREEFSGYDATELVTPFLPEVESEPAGCRCGEVLKGLIEPAQCGLFATSCTPDSPVGPCMVSSEGACAAHYNYRGVEESLR